MNTATQNFTDFVISSALDSLLAIHIDDDNKIIKNKQRFTIPEIENLQAIRDLIRTLETNYKELLEENKQKDKYITELEEDNEQLTELYNEQCAINKRQSRQIKQLSQDNAELSQKIVSQDEEIALLKQCNERITEERDDYIEKIDILSQLADDNKLCEYDTAVYVHNNYDGVNVCIAAENDPRTSKSLGLLLDNKITHTSLQNCRPINKAYIKADGTISGMMTSEKYAKLEISQYVSFEYYWFICLCCYVDILSVCRTTTSKTNLNFYGIDGVVAKLINNKFIFTFAYNAKNYKCMQKENIYTNNGGAPKILDLLYNICEYHDKVSPPLEGEKVSEANKQLVGAITSYQPYDRKGYNNDKDHELLIFPRKYRTTYDDLLPKDEKSYTDVQQKLDDKKLKYYSLRVDYLTINKETKEVKESIKID